MWHIDVFDTEGNHIDRSPAMDNLVDNDVVTKAQARVVLESQLGIDSTIQALALALGMEGAWTEEQIESEAEAADRVRTEQLDEVTFSGGRGTETYKLVFVTEEN